VVCLFPLRVEKISTGGGETETKKDNQNMEVLMRNVFAVFAIGLVFGILIGIAVDAWLVPSHTAVIVFNGELGVAHGSWTDPDSTALVLQIPVEYNLADSAIAQPLIDEKIKEWKNQNRKFVASEFLYRDENFSGDTTFVCGVYYRLADDYLQSPLD
jgi:hypothetical protein